MARLLAFILSLVFAPISAMAAPSVFILGGQSNMAGRGGTNYTGWNGIVPAECASDTQILRLNDELMLEEAHEPLHKGISLHCPNLTLGPAPGIGPGMPFANSILTRDPAFGVIGLVPCAVGGTAITRWARGGCLYNRLLTRVRAAVKGGGLLRAMLWYQGESDAENDEDAALYKGRLENFFRDVRTDLMSPSLPIIQVGIASGGSNLTNREIVRKAQLTTSLPNVKCVDAAGLPLRDKLHLTTQSQIRLGSMLADAFLRFCN